MPSSSFFSGTNPTPTEYENAVDLVAQATAQATAALASQTAAASSAQSAQGYSVSAGTSADTATTQAASASTSATSASNSATNAAASATTATNQATAAASSASTASTAATNASNSATAAAGSSSSASTYATNAANSATAAANSASDAAATLASALVKTNNLGDLSNASTARTNLGVAIGSNVQAWDADLDAIAAISSTSGLLKKTAANTWSLDTTSYLSGTVGLANGGTGATDAAGARTALGLGTAATAAATSFLQTANNLSEVTPATARTNLGLGTVATLNTASVLQSANNLSDLGSVSAARTSLGLSTVAATGAYSDLSGKPTLGSLAALSTVTLTSNVTGKLPVANGGTNQTSFTTNYVTYFDGTKLTGSSGLQYDGSSLSVAGNVNTTSQFRATTGTNGGAIGIDGGGLAFSTLNTTAPILFERNNFGAISMTIDSAGNLGLGVTPSAWNTITAFQVKNAAYGGYANNAYVTANAYYAAGGSWKYLGADYANAYMMQSGQHQWYIASSGAAAGTISFTQAMTLDASGSLVVNDTSTQYSSKIYANGSIACRHGGVDGTPLDAFIAGYSGNYNERNVIQTAVSSDGTISGFRFKTSNGANSSSTTTTLDLFRTKTTFYSGGSPAATIDSSGNLLVGQSSTASPGVSNTTTGIALSGTYIAASRNGDYSYFANRNTSDGGLFWFGRQGSFIGSISITTTAVAYNQTSDISLKENIAEAPSALQSILSMPVRQFDWKSNGSHTDYGVVAQEVNEYAPEIVTKGDLWCVDYGRITPRLIKAFQELAALEQELRSKVTALEAANGN